MARPSGAATTVSAPLNKRTAPLSRAAARALSSFDSGAPLGERPLGSNNRANSPACGVSTTGPGAALIACQSLSGSSEKLVSASASSTKARENEPPLSAVSTFSRVSAETPRPGPIATTFLRASLSNCSSAAASSASRSMTLMSAPAFIAIASRGLARVTSPAPARSAAAAASRAAPVNDAPPQTTRACPREYLCPSILGKGSASSQKPGALTKISGAMSASTPARMPILAQVSAPQCRRPGSSRCPLLSRKKVTVASASTATPRTAPVVPSMPEGMSTATTCWPLSRRHLLSRAISCAAGPSISRASPAPNSASTTRSVPSKEQVSAGSTAPSQAVAAASASPRRLSRGVRAATLTLIRELRSNRAAT